MIEFPILKIKNVLIVTLSHDMDDHAISLLQEKILESMEKWQTTGLILDISAVDTLDSFFARTLIETAQMTTLIGGKTIIVGMKPNVAITATQLGLTLGTIQTATHLEEGLKLLETLTHEES